MCVLFFPRRSSLDYFQRPIWKRVATRSSIPGGVPERVRKRPRHQSPPTLTHTPTRSVHSSYRTPARARRPVPTARGAKPPDCAAIRTYLGAMYIHTYTYLRAIARAGTTVCASKGETTRALVRDAFLQAPLSHATRRKRRGRGSRDPGAVPVVERVAEAWNRHERERERERERECVRERGRRRESRTVSTERERERERELHRAFETANSRSGARAEAEREVQLWPGEEREEREQSQRVIPVKYV